MKMFLSDGSGRREVSSMTPTMTRQAIAIADCVGRMIPQEGVDYDIEITFKGESHPDVSMSIDPHTDKGRWWRDYVLEMVKRYPPTIDNPEQAIKEGGDAEKLP